MGNTDDTKVTHKNNKTSKPSLTKDTNITNNSNGVLPIMKYKLLITNSSGISNDTNSIMQNEIEYNVSPTIFEEEVSASIEERMLDDTISNLLIKKFGKNTLLDTTIFELNIFNSSGEKVSFTIDEHEEFVVYIPVSEEFEENEDKIRLFNVTNEQLIVVNSRICVINDVLYFKIYFENPGVYVMVEDLGIIEKNDNSNSELINSNITNNNIPKDTESSSNNNQIYVAIALLIVGIVTLIITMARKSKTTINNVEALSETIIEKEAENLS